LGSSTGYKSQLWHPGWYLRFCFPDYYSVADVWREDATEEWRIAFSDRLRSVPFISKQNIPVILVMANACMIVK
jgi:hypothetical protein